MRRLIGLQYLRGIAAIGVVCHHALGRAGWNFDLGSAGVDLFFVLSGFLMWTITDARTTMAGFLKDRVERILPLYWIVTTVVLAGAAAGLFPSMRLGGWHVAASYLMLPAVSPSNHRVWPLLVPGWTLNYEIFFYAVFALLLLVARPRQLLLLTAALAVLVLVGRLIPTDQAAAYFYTRPRILEFLAGAWLGDVRERGWLAKRSTATVLVTAAIVGVVAAAVLPLSCPRAIAYGVPAILVVAAMLAVESRDDVVPTIGWALLIGNASYSIYLWHTLAISVVAEAGEKLALPAPAIAALAVVAGVGSGLVGYRLIEQPILSYFRRARYRHAVPIPGGV